jgi:uncharacterized hydrophobic protein (TIGR00271 family)
MALTPSASLFKRLLQPPHLPEEERRQILNELFFEDREWRPFVVRFSVLLVLSTMIAGLGLIADSVAVVIGAMLVAPLMTPILATAASVVYGHMRRMATSVAVLAAGTAAAIATGWVVSKLAPGTVAAPDLTRELTARTAPSLLDLGVAIAAGLAGGYVMTHPRAASSLPGVAIAVALVPPLATVGITLELGVTDAAAGAFLLFTTNLVAIILSAMVVMLASGFVPPDLRVAARGKIRIGLVVALMAVVGVGYPLTLHTIEVIEDQAFSRTVIDAVNDWDATARIVEVSADVGDSGAIVELVVASSTDPAPAWRLAEALSRDLARPVDVSVEYRLEQSDEATAG